MKSTVEFRQSAHAAASILDTLLSVSERHSRREQIPSLMELQTICREAGCDFADLNIFARVHDERPALLLCGGDHGVAREIAARIGYDVEPPDLPDAPLVWTVDRGPKSGVSLRRGGVDKAVSRKMLTAFLRAETKLDDLVFIEERVTGRSPWRFIWVPQPKYLVTYEEHAATFEVFVSQQAAVIIADDVPEEVRKLLYFLEQKRWEINTDQWGQEPQRAELLAEVAALNELPDDALATQAVGLWQYVAERLLLQIGQLKHRYQMQIEQQELKVKTLRHTLQQYQKNWSGGVRNIVDTHFQQRLGGKAFAAFHDAAHAGPDAQSFLAAAGLPALFTKVEQFVMDRMADFASGFEGMAVRMELHRITFGEMNARWTPRAAGPKLEALLTERRIFQNGGEKRGGLMAKMTGKAAAIVDVRKGQITQAAREMNRAITADFSDWCAEFMTAFEQNVRVQLAAALANQGMPDVDGLRAAMDGFDRLSHSIRHYRESTRTSENLTADWLRQLSSRRWIPLYQHR